MGRKKKYQVPTNPNYVVRLNGKDGNFRYEIPKEQGMQKIKIMDLKDYLEDKIGVPAEMIELFMSNPMTRQKMGGYLKDSKDLKEAGIRHGDVLLFEYDQLIESKQDEEAKKARKEKEEIQKKIESGDLSALSLSRRAKNWTMKEYLDMVEKYTIHIKTQKYAVASNCSLDDQAVQYFQIYLREMAFQIQRLGWIYGTASKGDAPQYAEDSDDEEEKPDPNIDTTHHDYKRVKCGVIYEPNQQGDNTGALEMKDPHFQAADGLAQQFGMSRVGYIFSHDGKREIPLLAPEIIQAAKRQAEYGDHFVTITAAANGKGGINVECFQVSKLCTQLVKDGKLKAHPDDPTKLVTTIPVSCQKKMVRELDAVLMIVNVPIQNTKSVFKVGFPVLNRTGNDHIQSHARLKNLLRNRSRMPFVEQIADFHLLLYLVNSNILNLKSDMPAIVEAIKHGDNNKVATYKTLIEAYISY